MSQPEVAVIILTWNGKHFLQEYLPSVLSTSYSNVRIIVADNASTDNTDTWLSANFPQVVFLPLGENYGFAEGYNRAIKEVSSEYVVLLNQDVEVTAGWLEPLVSILENDASVAAVQPKIKAVYDKSLFEYAGAAGGFIDRFGYPFCRGRIFNHLEKDIGQYDTVRPIAWASGACVLVRRSLYITAGGLDADLFAHMEEIDLCWRLKNMGYEIVCQPDALVYHLGGGSLPKESPRKTFLNFRNNLAIITKNYSGAIAYLLVTRFFLDLLAALHFLITGKFDHASAVLKAQMKFYQKFPSWLKKRSLERQRRSNPIITGFYPQSLLFDVYLRRVSTFDKLRW